MGSIQQDAIKSHQHKGNPSLRYGQFTQLGAENVGWAKSTLGSVLAEPPSTGTQLRGGNDSETRPKNVAVNWIIYAGIPSKVGD